MFYKIVFSLICFVLVCPVWPCTTFLITKKASKDGSMMIGHTDDDEVGDQRIVYIAAKNHLPETKRPIYSYSSNFPRHVGTSRSIFYDTKDTPHSKAVGYIDEVPHTYAYIEGNYGIINEFQLALGECTNSTKFYFDFDPQKRIIDIATLSQLALERCKTAKEAIILMGKIAEEHGYYGFGETLLLADTQEGWVFEITSTPKGESALWVAKKVPDGEVFVAANQFRIQRVDQDDPNVLYSSNLFDIAKKEGWLLGKNEINWQKSTCPGEFDHPYYSLRRVWRFFSLIAPYLHLSAYVEGPYTSAYPFSIKPDQPIALEKAFQLFRDHYENTPFDLTKGLASGPYGSPNRYLGSYDTEDFPDKRKKPLEGAWERPISIYYCGYSYITQSRDTLPDAIGGVAWIGFDAPDTTCYIPLYAGVLGLANCMQSGNPQKLDENFAWWPFNTANNWVSFFYGYASKDLIKRQKEIEAKELKEQPEIEKRALEFSKTSQLLMRKYLTRYCRNQVNYVVKEWWKLTQELEEKFNDGFINKPKIAERVGYPKIWRNQVGYQNGPVSYERKN